MAFAHGSQACIFVGGYDLSAMFNSVSSSQTADVSDVSVFKNTAKQYVAGLNDSTTALAGFFSDTSGESHERLNAALGVDSTVVSWMPQGDTVGDVAFVQSGTEIDYTVSADLTSAVTVAASFQSSTGLQAATVAHGLSEESTDGNETSVDQTSSSTAGGQAWLQVSAISGTPTLRIQHSSDDVTWVDLITFSPTAIGGDTASVTGTVDRYIRAEWTAAAAVTFQLTFRRN